MLTFPKIFSPSLQLKLTTALKSLIYPDTFEITDDQPRHYCSMECYRCYSTQTHACILYAEASAFSLWKISLRMMLCRVSPLLLHRIQPHLPVVISKHSAKMAWCFNCIMILDLLGDAEDYCEWVTTFRRNMLPAFSVQEEPVLQRGWRHWIFPETWHLSYTLHDVILHRAVTLKDLWNPKISQSWDYFK